LARDVARQQVHSGGDPMVTAAEDARIRQSLQMADLWLDPVTDLVAPTPTRRALSRAAWVEETLPVFQNLASPVAEHIVEAITGVLSDQVGSLGEDPLEQAMGSLGGLNAPGLLKRLGSAAFGMQLGGAVAHLASETFGLSDIGVPLGSPGSAALVPRNVDAFSDGLEIPADEVLNFLALREAAHTRLYGAAPWLRDHVIVIVRKYASEIAIDLPAMEEAFRAIDPSDPEQLRTALGSGVFALEMTESQRESLENLETTLAIIEGWVEHVTTEAARGQIPSLTLLAEMMRRRRAAGGPAEDAFKTLVGLELRPRRLRDAAALWAAVSAERGIEGRDQLWSHPDLLPNAAALDDPASLGRTDFEFDDALTALLEEGLGEE
ncbi:MAG: zinc-dependent metalloprotease, partial [Ruaniaceae bacterium]|nr:zinc-dependent metalloprotease [Ruaniaceae bacterium]